MSSDENDEVGGSGRTGRTGARRPHLSLTDPTAMRAIAHPTRLALLDAMALREPLTATEAAEIVGESPTNCAFHLRTLAKYGFVEEAPGGAGRRRPWRRTHAGFSIDTEDPAMNAETRLAADILAGVALESWLARVRSVLARRSALPPEQERLVGMANSVMFMTPEEADAFARDAKELMRRHAERSEDAALRPAGSVPVEVIQFTLPLACLHPGER